MEPKKDYPSIDRFICTKTIGKSPNSKVKLAIDSTTNEKLAIKIVKITETSLDTETALKNEFEIMKSLSHPNILKVYEYIKLGDYCKRNDTKLPVAALVMELAQGGELFSYLTKVGPFTEDTARSFFHSLIGLIQFLHLQGICHRNIKPENLLFDSSFNLKLTDFGSSKILAVSDQFGMYSAPKQESFYSPERIAKQQNYDIMGDDLFAAAIVLFSMVNGSPPFTRATSFESYYRNLISSRNDLFWMSHEGVKDNKIQQKMQGKILTL